MASSSFYGTGKVSEWVYVAEDHVHAVLNVGGGSVHVTEEEAMTLARVCLDAALRLRAAREEDQTKETGAENLPVTRLGDPVAI